VSEYVGKKDLARILGVSTRTIERLCRILNFPPTIPGWSGNRWSGPDAERFIAAIADYWRARGSKPIGKKQL
jgi:hypothetical protein